MRTRILGLLLALVAAGCQDSLTDDAPLPVLDEPYFRCRVQPQVTKYCSALSCHGDTARYYTVYARNRLRLQGGEEQRNDFMTDEERTANYAATRAFVEPGDEDSYVLLKILDQASGGFYHGGATEFGRGDVFLTRDDPDFAVFIDWINGATEDPACTEPGSSS